MYVVSATPQRPRPGPARRIIVTAIAVVVAFAGIALASFPVFAQPPTPQPNHLEAPR